MLADQAIRYSNLEPNMRMHVAQLVPYPTPHYAKEGYISAPPLELGTLCAR